MLWLAVEVNIFCWKTGLSVIGEAKVRVAGLQTAYMTSLNLCYIAPIGRIIFVRKFTRIEKNWESSQKKILKGLKRVSRRMDLTYLKHSKNWQII